MLTTPMTTTARTFVLQKSPISTFCYNFCKMRLKEGDGTETSIAVLVLSAWFYGQFLAFLVNFGLFFYPNIMNYEQNVF